MGGICKDFNANFHLLHKLVQRESGRDANGHSLITNILYIWNRIILILKKTYLACIYNNILFLEHWTKVLPRVNRACSNIHKFVCRIPSLAIFYCVWAFMFSKRNSNCSFIDIFLAYKITKYKWQHLHKRTRLYRELYLWNLFTLNFVNSLQIFVYGTHVRLFSGFNHGFYAKRFQ